MEGVEGGLGERGVLVNRAVRLFQFLARSQQLKSTPPRSVDSYESVLWFRDLPAHRAVWTGHREADLDTSSPFITIERVPQEDPPEPSPELSPWMDGSLDEPNSEPRLRDSISEDGRFTRVDDVPTVRESFAEWVARWRGWAEREQVDRPARTVYNQLFSTYVTAGGHAEELELVVGVGLLSWAPEGHDLVKRHVLSVPATIDFDDDTGLLSVRAADDTEGVTVELDMLDPGLVTNPQHVNQVKDAARGIDVPVLDRDVVGGLARRLVHALDGAGVYLDEDDVAKPTSRAAVSFAPALLLRKRSKQGIVDILDAVAEQLTESGEVPDGLLPLVDPDHRPASERSLEPGALVQLDDDPFLPLPVNDRQLRVLTHVDAKAQTLVQGPPGTGKTHTVAALLSHLLAQGKRVLVTAHTDRALKEVRAKLPEAIAPLAVSVVGSSRSDLADLKVAVERISDMAGDHDAHQTQQILKEHLEAIDVLRRRRATLYRRLLDARTHEVTKHEVAGYCGTLAAIGQQVAAQQERFGWLAELVKLTDVTPPPVATDSIVGWHRSLIDEALIADEPESNLRLLRPTDVPTPEAFAELVNAEQNALTAEARFGNLTRHPAFDAVCRLDLASRTLLQQRLNEFSREAAELIRRREAWMNDALADVLAGRATIWQSRAGQISQLIEQVGPLVHRLGPLTDVTVGDGELGGLVALATALRAHLAEGGSLKANPDGSPKIGAFAHKALKQAQPLFQSVRINGVPPTTVEHLDAFLMWADASRALNALDKAWPESVHVPPEDTLTERLQWHRAELAQLHRVLALGQALDAEERGLAAVGLPRPDWHDLDAVQTYAQLVAAAAAVDARTAAAAPLAELARRIDEVARWTDTAPCVTQLAHAVKERDRESYAAAYRRLTRLAEVTQAVAERNEISAILAEAVPNVHTAVVKSPHDPLWAQRLPEWQQAWSWVTVHSWLLGQEHEDVNDLQADVTSAEQQVRREVERLAAARAWSHAVSPHRLSGKARADLLQYAGLVKALGKGTGAYATQRKAEIKAAMDRCRPAVPVWIMPVYRIAEQFRIQPNMFDVVIVDEASQAGLEATFLQYLAPKIVVIGDDRQVSPSAVGTDQQQLRDLADQYLYDDPYRASWQNPKRSMFDEAKMRFEGMITLTEHRRCVPEIIGFSNRIAYEPEGIRLIPVRQYGADRLEPIKPVFLPDGYERGVTNKVNPVEADAIVDQIEKCIADPRYDGLTFGVVSLLGGAQAKMIENLLLNRIPKEEWRARELRCGDSADFQGSERDVMFLSMVKAPEPGKRIGALTMDQYVQRYNVAASRAKDQMWVFHSLRLEDLGNPEDMRFQLLDYCYGVLRRGAGEHGAVSHVVPEDRRVEPFDSLFEQRVFNRIVDRGYTVVPQYPAEGYRLDLVVVGAKTRLAIECDGDTWHGPEAYERDLARQRDLERCGWRFFRIRESEFYADPTSVLDRLWTTLLELDIHPSGWTSEDNTSTPVTDLPQPQAATVTAVLPRPEPTDQLPDTEPLTDEDLAIEENATVPVDMTPTDQALSNDPTPVTASNEIVSTALSAYGHFDDVLVPVAEASRRELIEGVERIVGAEGPVLGTRLHSVYVRASGGQRVGKLIAAELNKAITQAVRQGRLVEENPLGEAGVKPRTYRLPNQPSVAVRDLGPRSFEEIPPQELAALLDRVAERIGDADQEALQRAVLDLLGLKRLTDNVKKRFATVQARLR